MQPKSWEYYLISSFKNLIFAHLIFQQDNYKLSHLDPFISFNGAFICHIFMKVVCIILLTFAGSYKISSMSESINSAYIFSRKDLSR